MQGTYIYIDTLYIPPLIYQIAVRSKSGDYIVVFNNTFETTYHCLNWHGITVYIKPDSLYFKAMTRMI